MHFRVTALACACCALLLGACGGSSGSAHDVALKDRPELIAPRGADQLANGA